ncbi:MAG TPA: hydrolase [Thermoanaerobaculia bacterium]|jgi:nicotinamidase-related amidase
MTRLQRHDTILLVIDVQEKLMPAIDRADDVEANVERLVRGCHVLDVPPLLTEQYVKGLGATVPRVRRAFEETFGYAPIEKNCFSANGAGELQAALRQLRKKQVIVAGVEAHVCVYQTAADLIAAGHQVTVIADAVSSRAAENKALALQRMASDGAKLSSTEMALFELLGGADTDEFRQILALVK